MSISVQLGKISNFAPTSFLLGGNTKKCEDRKIARAGNATYAMLSSPVQSLSGAFSSQPPCRNTKLGQEHEMSAKKNRA